MCKEVEMTGNANPAFHLKIDAERCQLLDPQQRPFFALCLTDGQSTNIEELATDLNFNAVCVTPNASTELPCFVTVNGTPHPDIFDPAVQQALEDHVRQVCEAHRDDPNLIGYLWSVQPLGTEWVSAIRALPDETPGRIAYEEYLLFRYHGAYYEFERIYQARIEDYLTAPVVNWEHPQVLADDTTFMERIAAEYYRIMGETTRRHDPDHLIFGDAYTLYTDSDRILQVAQPYIDVLTLALSAHEPVVEELARLHHLTEKPLHILHLTPDGYDQRLPTVAALPYVVGSCINLPSPDNWEQVAAANAAL